MSETGVTGESGEIRVVPRQRTRQQLAEAPAKLATTLISVAAAGLLDAGRFRRGRQYATEGAVTEIVVRPGVVRGTVQGGRRAPYVVDVRVAMRPGSAGAPTGQQVAALAPAAHELSTGCTCPDADDGVCKHAAAVLLALADEVGDRPELLVLWRRGGTPALARATIGSRRVSATTAASGSAPSVAPSPFASPAWQEFFAAPNPLPTPLPPGETVVTTDDRVGSERLGELDLADIVRSARAALRRATDR